MRSSNVYGAEEQWRRFELPDALAGHRATKLVKTYKHAVLIPSDRYILA